MAGPVAEGAPDPSPVAARPAWAPSRYRLGADGGLRPVPSQVNAGSWFYVLAMLKAVRCFEDSLIGDLVDLGCGQAPFLGWYGDRVRSALLVDWPGSLHDVGLVDVFADLSQPLPLESASADTVLLSSVIEHLPEPRVTMAEVRRILRPGGCALVEIPFCYWLHEVPHDYSRLTEHGLRELCRAADLEVVHLAPFGTAFGVPCDALSKIGHTVFRQLVSGLPGSLGAPLLKGGESLLRGLQWLSFAIARSRFCQRGLRLATIERKLPLGYVLIARRAAGTAPGKQDLGKRAGDEPVPIGPVKGARGG
ncbi:MAG: class I SAM-dependent methyltransferase [Pseudomonadota bacterium]